MKWKHFLPIFLLMITSFKPHIQSPREMDTEKLLINQCDDFDPDGSGKHPTWQKADWIQLHCLDETPNPYSTKIKILYSPNGIYVLAHCEDRKISTEYVRDQDDIWEGDVFEVFFQTDPNNPLYFEYEINPLNAELVLLVPNNKGNFMGWAPWHYEGNRLIKRAVKVYDGIQKPGADISSWTAELFFPFALFKGFKNVPPEPGTTWKGNFYRMDYDSGTRIKWAWKPIEINFHQYEKYGEIVFR